MLRKSNVAKRVDPTTAAPLTKLRLLDVSQSAGLFVESHTANLLGNPDIVGTLEVGHGLRASEDAIQHAQDEASSEAPAPETAPLHQVHGSRSSTRGLHWR